MKTLSIHQVRNTVAVGIIGLLVGVAYVANPAFFNAQEAEAGTTQNISGWTWSENVGWISFNDTNEPTPYAGAPYGVNVDTTNKVAGGTGLFTGKAWSENVGWINFDAVDVAGCPAAPCQARVDWSTGNVTGWAHASNGSVASGWDGWIKMSDDTVAVWFGKGVKISGNRLSGYAWGGADAAGVAGVVGWIDFSPLVGSIPVGPIIGTPPCTIANVVTWGACQAISQCVAPLTSVPSAPGVRIGMCASGNTVIDSCTIAQTCTAAPIVGCGDGVCGVGETLLTCPKDCKAKVQQF